jgi:hypothetical protein
MGAALRRAQRAVDGLWKGKGPMFAVKRREFIALLGGVAAALPLRVALAVGILICPALARDDGRFNHLPVDLRDWFRSRNRR